jgi:hypothetical protein
MAYIDMDFYLRNTLLGNCEVEIPQLVEEIHDLVKRYKRPFASSECGWTARGNKHAATVDRPKLATALDMVHNPINGLWATTPTLYCVHYIPDGNNEGADRYRLIKTGPQPQSIIKSTDTTPIVLTTSPENPYENGDRVRVSGHGKNTNANGTWTVTARTSKTITLQGSTATGAGAGVETGTIQFDPTPAQTPFDSFGTPNPWDTMVRIFPGRGVTKTTTLTSAVNTSVTSLPVASTVNWPYAPFIVTVSSGGAAEIMTCTHVDTNSLTVTRAAVPKSHLSGASVTFSGRLQFYGEN